MDRWAGRVALVTGASAGIGRAIAASFAQHGMVVVACARSIERLQELKAELAGAKGTIVPAQCDVRKEDEILAMFEHIKRELGGVDVCVNNAGVAPFASCLSGSTDEWRAMLEINILALSICTRESVKSMRERGIDDGFIINIGSISGHREPRSVGLAFYAGTKHAVATSTKAVASELQDKKSRIKCVEISPGLVRTEIIATAAGQAISDRIYGSTEPLTSEDIADGVVYLLSAPLRARVSEIIIEPIAPVDLNKFKATNA